MMSLNKNSQKYFTHVRFIYSTGIVLESYGAGNIPSNREDIFEEIRTAVQRGVIVVNITQCATGAVVSPIYETGRVSGLFLKLSQLFIIVVSLSSSS